MKSQINIRASALLQRQLDELTEQLGTSITETVSIAIDRMYQQETKTMSTEKNLTDNAWINRVNELRQMVSDLPEAPTTEDEVHFYISSPDFFNSSDFDDADKDFLFAEMRRQYNITEPS